MANDDNKSDDANWGNTVAGYTALITLISAALFVGAVVFFIL